MKKLVIAVICLGLVSGAALAMTKTIHDSKDKNTDISEEPAASTPDLKPVYEQYLQILKEDEMSVDIFNNPAHAESLEQQGEGRVVMENSDNVALHDITGDGIPELFEQCYDANTDPYVKICSSDGKSVTTLVNDEITSVATNSYGIGSYLFEGKSSKYLYQISSGSEPSCFSVSRYIIEDGVIVWEDGYSRGYDVGRDEIHVYNRVTGDYSEKEISKDEFSAALDDYLEDIDGCIFNTIQNTADNSDDEFYAAVSSKAAEGSSGMKYADLVAFLENELK